MIAHCTECRLESRRHRLHVGERARLDLVQRGHGDRATNRMGGGGEAWRNSSYFADAFSMRSAIAGERMIAPIGKNPAVITFEATTMSGSIPYFSEPQNSPVRPNPQSPRRRSGGCRSASEPAG